MRTLRLLRFSVLSVACAVLAISLAAQTPATKAPDTTKKPIALLDINSATAAQLKTLTGIGDAYSAKIIAGRPYAKKDQLISKGILPQATYDKIKDMIIARQATTKPKAK
jgi:competence protein ComEA